MCNRIGWVWSSESSGQASCLSHSFPFTHISFAASLTCFLPADVVSTCCCVCVAFFLFEHWILYVRGMSGVCACLGKKIKNLALSLQSLNEVLYWSMCTVEIRQEEERSTGRKRLKTNKRNVGEKNSYRCLFMAPTETWDQRDDPQNADPMWWIARVYTHWWTSMKGSVL